MGKLETMKQQEDKEERRMVFLHASSLTRRENLMGSN